jgi:serine phosphatase RsbU (regulator of sigma subunit)
MLGVLPPGEFGVGELSLRLAAGDTLLLYTDGAFESRDREGRKLGLERLREALRREGTAGGPLSQGILTLVDNHARGVIDDDVLVATVRFTGPTEAATSEASRPDEAEAYA